jgi:hypothetical protein
MLALLVGRAAGRSYPAAFWVCAWGFLVSVFADVAAGLMTGPQTWMVAHVYPAPQLALFAIAAGAGTRETLAFGAWLIVAVATSLAVAPLDRPEYLVTALGSVAVCYFALSQPTPLRASLLTYCGLGTALYLAMIARVDDCAAFMPWWTAYQGARLTAFGLFARAAWRADA